MRKGDWANGWWWTVRVEEKCIFLGESHRGGTESTGSGCRLLALGGQRGHQRMLVVTDVGDPALGGVHAAFEPCVERTEQVCLAERTIFETRLGDVEHLADQVGHGSVGDGPLHAVLSALDARHTPLVEGEAIAQFERLIDIASEADVEGRHNATLTLGLMTGGASFDRSVLGETHACLPPGAANEQLERCQAGVVVEIASVLPERLRW